MTNSKKIYIIIQGNTKYCDTVISTARNIDNVVWVTDTDTAPHDLYKIQQSGIKFITIDKINPAGWHYSNWETSTTMAGLRYAKSMGAEYCVKIRADVVCSDWNKFKDKMVFDDKLHCLYYVQHYGDRQYHLNGAADGVEVFNLNYHDSWLQQMGYKAIVSDLGNWNYVCDFIVHGTTDEMLEFWDLPYEPDGIHVAVEHKYVLNYLKNKGLTDISLSFEYLNKYFSFYLHELQKHGINMFFLKNLYNMSSELNKPEQQKHYLSLEENLV